MSREVCVTQAFWWTRPFTALTDSVIYSFHMPLFFCLAGWFFYESWRRRGTRGLIYSKVNTVVYPFVLWSLLQGTLEVNLAAYTNGNLSYGEVFSLFWAPRAPFWFLYALFLIFALTALAFRGLQFKGLQFKGLTRHIGVVFAFTALLYVFQDRLALNDPLFYVLDNWFFFMLGVVLSRLLPSLPKDALGRGRIWVATGLAFGAGQYLFHNVWGLTFEDKGIASLLLALVSIVFVLSTARGLARVWQGSSGALAYVGEMSLAIYLMHILAAAATRIFLNILGVDSVMVHLLAGCAVGLLAPLAVAAVVARLELPFVFSMPLSNYAKRSVEVVLDR